MARRTDSATASAARLRKEFRVEFGQWLRDQRINADLTMLDVSKALGFSYYNDVGIYESGRTAVPSQYYVAYAQVLEVERAELAKRAVRAYDPIAWDILFGTGKGVMPVPKVRKK